MNNRDLYQKVVGELCKHTGYDEASIINRNIEGCVDARYVLVYMLGQRLTDDEISRETGMARQSVNYIRNHFDSRMNKWSIRNLLFDISGKVCVLHGI